MDGKSDRWQVTSGRNGEIDRNWRGPVFLVTGK
jgi:hypothetical protein